MNTLPQDDHLTRAALALWAFAEIRNALAAEPQPVPPGPLTKAEASTARGFVRHFTAAIADDPSLAHALEGALQPITSR